ncbi:protein LATERAL ROOT PRIMORDIUM 1-like [Andrographis paniculata]|uniref:protein LATERAL ROOT PRIMORDIUM 1-like n=1 Tax=Andrographis paniculata TaxID=175694 RepID=UPI0021E94E8E|nr:protein LATERAL ROOT PRIMORDIUM 1-like [Andrographis paniculata]XP_051142051.1 protein LATERAL ROOT PRIMORDIUM 1-like [Andrographis paniculata]
MWPNAAAPTRHVNCGLPPEFFFVAPASSFQHHHPAEAAAAINFDPHSLNASNTIGVGVGVGVIPLLATAPTIGAGADEDLRNRGGGMQLWQHQQVENSGKKPTIADHTNLLRNAAIGGGGGSIGIGGPSSSSSSVIGAATCQDCGNQAKKDCPHRRCRTCCKSRGYDCSTHVKSTWVPAARRRERQLITGSSQSTSGAKKPKLAGAAAASHNTSTSTTATPPRSFDTTSSHQEIISFKDTQLPQQVRAPAVFNCVKVTALHDGDDEYAYQAAVRIGGHIFKGFLYDQGFEEEGRSQGFPDMSDLQLGGARNHGSSSTPPILNNPSEIYATAAAASGVVGMLAGSDYGNGIN